MFASQPLETRHTDMPTSSASDNPQLTLEERLAHAPVRKLASKEHLFCEGDPRIYVFRVEAGVITIYKTLCDGRRRIIDFAHPGEIIGLGAIEEHVLSAQAPRSAVVRCLSASALESLAEADATLALKLYKSVCQELAATRNLLVTLGQRSAIERLASFLMAVRRRAAGGGDTVMLTMRRSDIADLLGLTIETVSRTLTKLRSMGVIEVEQGGTTVKLCDVPRLVELANE